MDALDTKTVVMPDLPAKPRFRHKFKFSQRLRRAILKWLVIAAAVSLVGYGIYFYWFKGTPYSYTVMAQLYSSHAPAGGPTYQIINDANAFKQLAASLDSSLVSKASQINFSKSAVLALVGKPGTDYNLAVSGSLKTHYDIRFTIDRSVCSTGSTSQTPFELITIPKPTQSVHFRTVTHKIGCDTNQFGGS